MLLRRLCVILIAFSVLLVTVAQVKAYGVASFSLSCTSLTLSGWTDTPLQNPITGDRYVMGTVMNLTTGQNFTFSPTIRKMIGTTGTYRDTISWALVGGFTISPGDSLRFRMWDRYSDLMDMTGVCGGMGSDGGVPSSFSLRTMTCTTPLLAAPAGPPVTNPDGTPNMIQVGTRRYAKAGGSGEIGSDGLTYIGVRASYTTYGYIRASCVGSS